MGKSVHVLRADPVVREKSRGSPSSSPTARRKTSSLDKVTCPTGWPTSIRLRSVQSSSDQRQTDPSCEPDTKTSCRWLMASAVTGPRWWSMRASRSPLPGHWKAMTILSSPPVTIIWPGRTEETQETAAMCSLMRNIWTPLRRSQTMTLRSSLPLITWRLSPVTWTQVTRPLCPL